MCSSVLSLASEGCMCRVGREDSGVSRVFSEGFKDDVVPELSPEGGVGDDLDHLW